MLYNESYVCSNEYRIKVRRASRVRLDEKKISSINLLENRLSLSRSISKDIFDNNKTREIKNKNIYTSAAIFYKHVQPLFLFRFIVIFLFSIPWNMASDVASVSAWFQGRNVFVTGGSGFMGKVLIYKLLLSCHDLGNIYVLVRKKKDVDPQSRLKLMMQVWCSLNYSKELS